MQSASRILRKINHNPVADWIWTERYLIVYRMDAETALTLPADPGFRVNSEDDIACFQETERWHNRENFIHTAQQGIEQGQKLYTFVEDGVLLYYRWMVPRQTQAWFPYVQQHFQFPPDTAVLYGAYTHPASRGKGLHQRGQSRMAHDAVKLEGAKYVYNSVESHNRAARHVPEKLGSRPVAIPFLKRKYGVVRKGVLTPEAFTG